LTFTFGPQFSAVIDVWYVSEFYYEYFMISECCICTTMVLRNYDLLSERLLLGRIAVLRTYMRSIIIDRVAWSVSLSDTLVSLAKTAAPVQMPFGLRTWLRPRNHVLDGGPDYA